jgi:exosortase/archaeosortase family protein
MVNPITTDTDMRTREETRDDENPDTEDTARPTPGDLILYLAIAIIITVIVYFLPEPFFLAIPTAYCSAAMLSTIQVPSIMLVDWIQGAVFVSGIGFQYEIIRDCTGIQVIAVFAGLILPLPRGTWKRKGLSVAVVSILLFIANVLRVVYEIWLVYWGIMTWEYAHYPMSFVLGVVGVFVLCLVAIWLLPGFIETFEDFIYYIFPPKEKGASSGGT